MSKHKNKGGGGGGAPTGSELAQARRRRFAEIRAKVVGVALGSRNLHQQLMTKPAPGTTPLSSFKLLGTGFKIGEPDLFLTAKHVVQGWHSEAQEAAKKQSLPANLLYALIQHSTEQKGAGGSVKFMLAPIVGLVMANEEDIAVFHCRVNNEDGSKRDMKPLAMAAGIVEEGDEVATCGFPFGLDLHRDQMGGFLISPSFSQGIVSAALPFPGAPPQLRTVFQLDAMINGGNSGGPVFDVRTGLVTGMVVSTHEKGASVPTGLARGVYIHRAKPLIEKAAEAAPGWTKLPPKP